MNVALERRTVADRETREAVEQFLYFEARLLDEHRYEDWEALWVDEGVYWVPAFHDADDPDRQVSLVYDSRAGIAARVKRLAGSHAYAQQPRTRLVRVVSNVEVYRDPDGAVEAHSNFMLNAQRQDDVSVLAGRVTHVLRGSGGLAADRAVDGSLRIARKVVRLVPLEIPLGNLSFVL
jgi:benzoate/toluate 1,2-dioxygenase beta subunit